MTRLENHALISAKLASLSDTALCDLLDHAHPLGSGIGGKSCVLTIEERPVFVKRIRLTELEEQPGNILSTANLFDLPLYCQYRVGSPGFGVWREVAAHRMATEWVLSGLCAYFPLMYHWRIIRGPGASSMGAEQADELEQILHFWGESGAIRRRLQALHDAQACVALFLEYVPRNLHQWLGETVVAGGLAADAAVRRVDAQIKGAAAVMAAHGLTHFDLHFENILTDGEQLYVSDFGLASSADFDLSMDERAFLEQHRGYDRYNAALSFVICFVRALLGHRPWEALLQEHGGAEGADHWAPPAAAEIIRRDAATALALKAFFRTLGEDNSTLFPAAHLESLVAGMA